jgi:hypothetical protein
MESVSHDMPVEASAVHGTRHGAEANGTNMPHTHRMSDMATPSAETSESTTMAAAATAAVATSTSGKNFAWSKNYEGARERDRDGPVHARLHV